MIDEKVKCPFCGQGRFDEAELNPHYMTDQCTAIEIVDILGGRWAISKPEAYGTSAECGNKYWLYALEVNTRTAVRDVVRDALRSRKKEKAVLSKAQYTVGEITFFVYLEPQKTMGVDSADTIYVWTKKKGLALER